MQVGGCGQGAGLRFLDVGEGTQSPGVAQPFGSPVGARREVPAGHGPIGAGIPVRGARPSAAALCGSSGVAGFRGCVAVLPVRARPCRGGPTGEGLGHAVAGTPPANRQKPTANRAPLTAGQKGRGLQEVLGGWGMSRGLAGDTGSGL